MNNAARTVPATARVAFVLVALLQCVAPRPADAAAIGGVAALGADLHRATSVPVLLPASLPDSIVGGGGIHIVETSATASGYEASIVAGKTCKSAFCHVGFMRGMRSPSGTPAGTIVHYGRSKVAYYTAGSCVGGCRASTLVWTAGGFRYELGIRGGSLNALRFTAASTTRY